MDIRPVLYIVGIFLCVLAISMAIPTAMDIYDHNEDWKAFATAMSISLFCGVLLILSNRQQSITITGKNAFILTAVSWGTLSFFSALPFVLAFPEMSYTNALFESVSGLTTTGSTVMTSLDTMPRGILIWRAILQWLGGIGIIVMAISILPFLKVGGMQLFRLESSEKEKAMPNASDMAKWLFIVYILITFLCAFLYYLSDMSPFDAAAHSMTTIATGGFSTHDSSFTHFSDMTKIITIIFMILACFPFIVFLKMYTQSIKELFRDEQIAAFLKLQLLFCGLVLLYMTMRNDNVSLSNAIDYIFNTVSIATGTGFSSANYMLWGPFIVGLMFFIGAAGGCAGSTSCGIKIFRLQILTSVAITQIQQLIYPNGVFTIKYRDEPLGVTVAASVMAFFFVYMISIMVVTLLLMATDLDLMTAASGAMSAISNVGPGLGDIIGPTGTFQPLADSSKWILIFAMMLGRLEFFTLLVFLSPRFWRT